MTVIADNKKRVVLAKAKPGDRFDVQMSANGYFLQKLEPVQSRPANVRFEKRGGHVVAIADQPINEQGLQEALAEFP
jgi:hypothetical protein